MTDKILNIAEMPNEMLCDPGIFNRSEYNPVLSSADIPYESLLVFNPGVTKWQGQYVMVFRNDWGDHIHRVKPRGSNLGLAVSDDGINWDVKPQPVFEIANENYRWAYDPRLTEIDGRLYMCFAVDSTHGTCGGVAVTDDLENFEILYISAPETRNMVLLPERVNGMLCRMERPMVVYGKGGGEDFDIWMSMSKDGKYWGTSRLVLGSDQVDYCNSKIGPSAPPIKTPQGWLTLIHVVHKPDCQLKGWEPGGWGKEYGVGVVLLDLDEPWKVIAMSDGPVMWADDDYSYEIDGYRGSVIFPCGMFAEDQNTLRIYYGASDTCIATATASISELIATLNWRC